MDVYQAALPVTIIVPPRGWHLLNFRELWKSRELLLFLTWRDVMVRYKQTVLGAAWAILQPAMMMVVFTVFLGRLARVDSGDLPYPVFVYAGLLPWTFFATAITNAGNSVVGSAQMVSKIYFPRLFIPMACVAAAVVDFLIAFLLLAGLMLYYGIRPGWGILLVPLVLALAALAAVGVGALLAALNVAYRDFKYTIPFLVQIWMFATPTVYMNVDASDAPCAASANRPSSLRPPPIGRLRIFPNRRQRQKRMKTRPTGPVCRRLDQNALASQSDDRADRLLSRGHPGRPVALAATRLFRARSLRCFCCGACVFPPRGKHFRRYYMRSGQWLSGRWSDSSLIPNP